MYTSYPGGKGNSFRKIINCIPPHRLYIEPFLGAGAVMRHKKPAARNIGIDADAAAIATFAEAAALPGNTAYSGEDAGCLFQSGDGGRYELYCADALTWLRRHRALLTPDAFLYLDPPYLLSTRKRQRAIYAHEFSSAEEHRALLMLAKELRCMVLISGYASDLYASELSSWNSFTFLAVTRGGTLAEEWLWCNYPEPEVLHCYDCVGDDCRERERIKRKKERWLGRLERMDRLERQALLSVMEDYFLRPPSPGKARPDPARRQSDWNLNNKEGQG